MESRIVSTKTELESALKAGTQKITVVGPYAEQIAREYQRRHKKNKIAKTVLVAGAAVAIGLASVVAAPVTSGISLTALPASAALAAEALTVGSSLTISTVELAIICGFALGMYGLSKDYNVKFNKDGNVEITKK